MSATLGDTHPDTSHGTTNRYKKATTDQSLSPQSKAHQRVWLRMHHFIHVFHTEILSQTQVVPRIKTFIEPWWVLWIHQQQRRAQREMCWHSPALTHDSYVAAIQVSPCINVRVRKQKLSQTTSQETSSRWQPQISHCRHNPKHSNEYGAMHHFIHVWYGCFFFICL